MLEQAASLRPAIERGPGRRGEVARRLDVLRGCTVVNLFFEPSTRTRTSFEIAGQRLGASMVNFFSDGSTSAAKGETVLDTVRTLEAMGVDALVIRGRQDFLPHKLADSGLVNARVVNAGDGRNEHPTQALLDALTIIEAFDRSPREGARTLAGLRVAICGDILHSRVAHSGARLLAMLGARVRIAGPAGLVGEDDGSTEAIRRAATLDEAIEGAHVIMMLRIQRERLSSSLVLPDVAAYHAEWGLTARRLERAHPDAIVMHPGPMNRGVEISSNVADGPRSRILRQVALGVVVRMAVLARACGVPLELA